MMLIRRRKNTVMTVMEVKYLLHQILVSIVPDTRTEAVLTEWLVATTVMRQHLAAELMMVD